MCIPLKLAQVSIFWAARLSCPSNKPNTFMKLSTLKMVLSKRSRNFSSKEILKTSKLWVLALSQCHHNIHKCLRLSLWVNLLNSCKSIWICMWFLSLPSWVSFSLFLFSFILSINAEKKLPCIKCWELLDSPLKISVLLFFWKSLSDLLFPLSMEFFWELSLVWVSHFKFKNSLWLKLHLWTLPLWLWLVWFWLEFFVELSHKQQSI